MSDPLDASHEFELLEDLRDAEERERNKPYTDPDDYHDELREEDDER